MSSHWHDIGVLLGLSTSWLDIIHSKHDVRVCCRDVLQEWIKKGSSAYSATWGGLLTLLSDVELNSCAQSLQVALKHIS